MYKPKKNFMSYFMIMTLIILNIILIYITKNLASYTLWTIIKISLIIFDLYEIYYIIFGMTLNYEINEKSVIIKGYSGIKKITIDFKDIIGYKVEKEIDGIKLSGVIFSDFAIGRCYIERLGTTRMYITSKDEVIYILTKEMNFAITPKEVEGFRKALENSNVKYIDHDVKSSVQEVSLHKDKIFMIPLVITSILSFIMIIVPFIYYLKGGISYTMPIGFDARFNPTKFGTGKQFAFQQMIYGSLNLALLFCMYFASSINAKYDRKSSYKYIYIALVVAITFTVMQFKILSLYL
ncbi:PH domain-containing protein [Hathewaya histolytica]|uniref:Membrane protein n=2 Tax=Hathewaya histolytica TaxID=1498 RepID=A0A4U9RF99_HATHI|nr:PH domain-containing protein [Hathewaya histolytica]VTQ90542.1 membrane protein [Hathewaya histolytica]